MDRVKKDNFWDLKKGLEKEIKKNLFIEIPTARTRT